MGRLVDSGYATAAPIERHIWEAPNMAASLIAISLVLMIMRGMAALLKAGSDSKSSKDDDPRP